MYLLYCFLVTHNLSAGSNDLHTSTEVGGGGLSKIKIRLIFLTSKEVIEDETRGGVERWKGEKEHKMGWWHKEVSCLFF